MPEFTSHPPGTPSWVDLMSPDVDASKAFYTAVFGWDAEDQLDDDGNRVYVMFTQAGKSVAGLGGQPPTSDTATVCGVATPLADWKNTVESQVA